MRARILSSFLTLASHTLMFRDRHNGDLKRYQKTVPPDIERWTILSGNRKLTGNFLSAGDSTPALLVCHGIGELIEYWGGAQAMLRSMGISSLVFDYSGYRKNSGTFSCTHCEEDAIAAYRMLSGRIDNTAQPVFLLGFSLGTGVVSTIAADLPIAGVILCEGYTSMRDAAAATGVPRWLSRIVHNTWRTVDRVRELNVPTLVMHSHGDRLFPVHMARSVADACAPNGTLVLVEDLQHNAPIFTPTETYWRPVADWIKLVQSQATTTPAAEVASPQ